MRVIVGSLERMKFRGIPTLTQRRGKKRLFSGRRELKKKNK